MADDQRCDHVTREILQRLVDEAATKAARESGREGGRQGAIEVLNAVSTHDMATKEGQEEFRADVTWANKNRVRCERVGEKAWYVGGGVVGLGILGASWDHIMALANKVFFR